jgi:FemAB-related protein (PEP-CTERM system-associated)
MSAGIATAVNSETIRIQTLGPQAIAKRYPKSSFAELSSTSECALSVALCNSLRWLDSLRDGLGHTLYLVEATTGERTIAALPLAHVRSPFFGSFLVSLPYVNSAGVIGTSPAVISQLVDAAVALADNLQVRYLELRQEQQLAHAALAHTNDSKVLMRLSLPATTEALWDRFKSKLRSQIRAGEKHDFTVTWGGKERLAEFYQVFSRNMRDLGTPVYSRQFFAAILTHFAGNAELCVVRIKEQPIAGALLIHGSGCSEVPSASSLREFNSTNANMVMYWHLLQRAIDRGQQVFDFGRSTVDSNTYRFKKQWGAEPSPSIWQYYLRRGSIADMRPENAKFGLAIRTWRRLPVWLTQMIGPAIVRGIP